MHRLTAFILLLSAVPAAAQDRDLCTDRPGLGTPPCIVDRGHVVVEAGLADWTRASDPNSRTDIFTAGDMLVRYGVTDTMEVQAGWTAFGRQRERDRLTGAVDRGSGVGDVTLALRRNLANPDGEGTSIAIMPYATIPTGGGAIGTGDWSAGLLMPMAFALPGDLKFELMPEVDAAVDEDRNGRHLAYGGVVGLAVPLSDAVTGNGEVSLMRDDDPMGHETHALAGLSLAWQMGEDFQVDGGANVGLNRASDDVELYVGIARRF